MNLLKTKLENTTKTRSILQFIVMVDQDIGQRFFLPDFPKQLERLHFP